MTTVIVATAIAALGVCGLAVGLRPRRSALGAPAVKPPGLRPAGAPVAGRLATAPTDRHRRSGSSGDARWGKLEARWSEIAATTVAGHPELAGRLERWLWLADQSWEALVARQVRSAGLASIAACMVVVVPLASEVRVAVAGVVLRVLVVVAATGVGLAVPVFQVRRRALRQADISADVVSTYADLVVLCLAGGMGIESALLAAATVADDPVTRLVERSLTSAADAGRSPWDALTSVGAALGVDALVDLAGAVALAGTEGAAVRATLASRAASLRERQAAATEARANAATERLFVPGVVLLLGFLVFLGYPAVARIASGL